MELWIRSQDKEALRKVNCSLYLREDLSDYANGEVWFIVSSGDKLGEYATKERALEVLDEIQNLLKPKTIINVENFNATDARILCDKFKEYSPVIIGNDSVKIEPLGFIVYEMPKE